MPEHGAHPSPHLVPKVLEKSRATPILPLRACVAYKMGENLPTCRRFHVCVCVWCVCVVCVCVCVCLVSVCVCVCVYYCSLSAWRE